MTQDYSNAYRSVNKGKSTLGNRSEGPLVEAYSNLEPVRLNLLTVKGSMLEGMPLAGAVNED